MIAQRFALFAARLLVMFGLLGAIPRSGAAVSPETKEAYTALRKQFFVAVALKSKPGSLRKEHRNYLQSLTAFLETIKDQDPLYLAAGQYLRGRMFFRVGMLPRAQADFAACLKLLTDNAVDEAAGPSGLPTKGSVQVFQAFADPKATEPDSRLQLLEAIPADKDGPKYFEVGRMVNTWADALAAKDDYANAKRAYEFIKKHELFDEEEDNPQRKIELLHFREQGGAGFQE